MKPSDEYVLILYNEPESAAGACSESERGVLGEVDAVAGALGRLGVSFTRKGARALKDVPRILAETRARLVFNLVEGFPGAGEDANLVPAVCRAFGRFETGNDTTCLSLALDKTMSKRVLAAAGVPVPPGAAVAPGARFAAGALPPGRYIVKPALSDASEGIHPSSVVDLPGPAAARAIRRVHEQFGQPALIERFVGSRELNVSVISRGGIPEVMPLAEIDFSAFAPGKPRIIDYAAKWHPESFEYNHTPRILPARLPARVAAEARRTALAAWRALGCRDYARVDMRFGDGDPVTVIEVNPNPDISPEAGFAHALAAGGLAFEAFVEAMLLEAMGRLQLRGRSGATAGAPAVPAPARAADPGTAIRRSLPRDRDRVLDLLAGTGFFRADEIPVAQEVIDDAVEAGPEGHYQSFVIEESGTVAGWVCFGPTPCTIGTFDIYWIAVAADRQGKGLGRALLRHAESEIAARGGRLSVLETSGKKDYEPTRGFYLKCGYHEASRIADFYAPGDDKVVYVRRLG